jgi:hypothetical protein
MPKQPKYLQIELDGSITECKNPTPLTVLNQQWLARIENGDELAIVTIPATNTAKQKKLVTKTVNRCMYRGNRYALWPVPNTDNMFVGSVDPGILMLRIDGKGKVHDQKREAKSRGEHISSPFSTRMLAGRLFPGIELALVQVPTRMTDEESFRIKNTMANLLFEGKRYRLVGATGGAKDGKFYFCEQKWESPLKNQYQGWAEAAISYFGILVSECDKALIETTATVRVCRDGEFGTNDSRAWVSQSLFNKLELAGGALYQFRLALEQTQAKGTFKVMPDEVAQHPDVAADIVLPESSIKPSRGDMIGKLWSGPIVLGVREVSRTDTSTKGSYTVLQHASWPVIENEIMGKCRAKMNLLQQGFDSEEHAELIDMIGASNRDTGYFRVVEACLLSDRNGTMSRHPHIFRGICKMIAPWAYKLLTGGGMAMPGRTLVDDGYLAVHEGKLYEGSDWIPYDHCLTDQPGERNLCVRFPVRMVEDLLPMHSLTAEQTVELLVENGLPREIAGSVYENQLMLHGTYTLHAKRAKTFGGDYDGDGVAVINSKEYPMFVEYRFALQDRQQPEKTKPAKRKKSPWFNIYEVAFKSMGNRVGVITNIMSSALAAGRSDLAYQLVEQLQLEIDGLKHGTAADMKVVQEISLLVGRPEWLDIDKKLKSVLELPASVKPLSEADNVGLMYNILNAELREMLGEANSIQDYSGLFNGLCDSAVSYSDKFTECRIMNGFYGGTMHRLNDWLNRRFDAVKAAKMSAREARLNGDKVESMIASAKLREAEAELEKAKRNHKQSVKELREAVCAWGAAKPENEKMAWASVMNRVLCKGSGSGSLLEHVFPQQFADAVSSATGGERVLVDGWVANWTLEVDITARELYQVNLLDNTRVLRFKQIEYGEKNAEGKFVKQSRWKRANITDVLQSFAPGFDEDDLYEDGYLESENS